MKEMRDIKAQIEDVTTRDPLEALRERWRSGIGLPEEEPEPPRSSKHRGKKPHS